MPSRWLKTPCSRTLLKMRLETQFEGLLGNTVITPVTVGSHLCLRAVPRVVIVVVVVVRHDVRRFARPQLLQKAKHRARRRAARLGGGGGDNVGGQHDHGVERGGDNHGEKIIAPKKKQRTATAIVWRVERRKAFDTVTSFVKNSSNKTFQKYLPS